MGLTIFNSVEATQALGETWAAECKGGEILALHGVLGTGKTQLVKGLARGLGYTGDVTSPTFTIVHEYRGGRLPVYHFDLFRVENPQALARLGLDDYFFGDGISVIEWADRFREFVPEQARWIFFEIKSETQRAITFQ